MHRRNEKNVIVRQMSRWTVYDRIIVENPQLEKYWTRAHVLFPEVDNNNLLVDIESWYSITPKDLADSISKEIAKKYGSAKALDLFSGVGGNTISLLKYGHSVVSAELDYKKVKYLRYNVKQCIKTKPEHTILHKDVYSPQMLRCLEGRDFDALIASPPWGGVGYSTLTELELLNQCRILELENMYEEKAKTRIYIIPRTISKRLIHKVLECKTYKGVSNQRVVAHIVITGDSEGIKF